MTDLGQLADLGEDCKPLAAALFPCAEVNKEATTVLRGKVRRRSLVCIDSATHLYGLENRTTHS